MPRVLFGRRVERGCATAGFVRPLSFRVGNRLLSKGPLTDEGVDGFFQLIMPRRRRPPGYRDAVFRTAGGIRCSVRVTLAVHRLDFFERIFYLGASDPVIGKRALR